MDLSIPHIQTIFGPPRTSVPTNVFKVLNVGDGALDVPRNYNKPAAGHRGPALRFDKGFVVVDGALDIP